MHEDAMIVDDFRCEPSTGQVPPAALQASIGGETTVEQSEKVKQGKL